MLMDLLWAGLIGGVICIIGQLLMDVCKLTPAHTMTILVVAGAVLGAFGLYQPLIDLSGAGATTPISSFGNSLVQGALAEANSVGILGVITGIFEITSAGISSAILFAFFSALVFKPKG